MNEEIQNIRNEALAQIMEAANKKDVSYLKTTYLGRKGKLSSLIKRLPELSIENRKAAGILLNQTKKVIENALDEKFSDIQKTTIKEKWFDISLPGITPEYGHYHPQTTVLKEIVDIFTYLGYQVADGPEIETDYYNFSALNFPKDHPARDAQQTMFFDTSGTKFKLGEIIPRTHTSSMQGRIMEKTKPPIRVIVPGRCFRYEQIDASHGIEFWQVEGFVVDKNIKFTDLLGTIEYVLIRLFGKDTEVRFATTYFPFVEPGLDAYIKCTVCNGKGCSFCKSSGWSEIMPAGMIHPNVLTNSGINPKKWGGFAFAIGLSRVVTLRYKIQDLRILNSADLRNLKQF
jgi:phenylalanyl-tRNA synthetase alpha chain